MACVLVVSPVVISVFGKEGRARSEVGQIWALQLQSRAVFSLPNLRSARSCAAFLKRILFIKWIPIPDRIRDLKGA